MFYHTLIITIGTFFSKLLGLTRDASIAWLLGNTTTADALTIALRLPFFFRRLLGEGSLSIGLTSICRHESICSNSGIQLTLRISVIFALIIGTISSVVWFIPTIALDILAPGFNWEHTVHSETIQLFRICLPYIIFAILTSGCIAVLHSERHFLLPALSPVLFNSSVIIFALISICYTPIERGIFLSYGVLCGGIFQWMSQLPLALYLKKAEPKVDYNISIITEKTLRVPKDIFIASIPQLTFILATTLTSFLPTGHVALLFYAERLIEFPIGILSSAIGIITLPVLTTIYRQNKLSILGDEVSKNVSLILAINFPAALGLIAISMPLVQTIFYHGEFNFQAVNITTFALCAYAPGLPAIALSKTLLSTYYAINNQKIPFYIGILTIIMNLLLGTLLLYFFDTIGPPLAASLSLWFYCWLLWKKLHCFIPVHFPCKKVLLQLLAACCTFILSYTTVYFLSDGFPVTTICIVVPIGIISYVVSLYLLDKKQLIQLMKNIRYPKSI